MAARIPLPSDDTIILGLPDTSGLAPELDELRGASPTAVTTEHLDPITAEVVRLRNAVHQGCNLCQGLRSKSALDSGATEDQLSAVLRDERGGLTPHQQAAAQVADAYLVDAGILDDETRTAVLQHLTPEQLVEVVVRLANWSYNKVLISLGFDLDEIRPQVY